MKKTMVSLGIVAAALTLTGCGDSDKRHTEPQPTSTASQRTVVGPKPVEVVGSAAARLQTQSFKLVMTSDDGSRVTGVIDPAAHAASFTVTGKAGTAANAVYTEMRFIGEITYIRIVVPRSTAPGTDGKTWRRLTSNTPGSAQNLFNGSGVVAPLAQAVEVRRVSDTRYTGNFDLAKSDVSVGIPRSTLGEFATTKVPFEVTLDSQGRLIRYTFTTPAIGSQRSQRLDMTFSDFGVPVLVKAPPTDQIVGKPAR